MAYELWMFNIEWFFSLCLSQKLCEDKSVDEILQKHYNSCKDFRSLHSLLVRTAIQKQQKKNLSTNVCCLCSFPKAVDPDSARVFSQLLAVSRVSVSNPTLRAVDLLEASRMSSADSKGNILHGESIKHTN